MHITYIYIVRYISCMFNHVFICVYIYIRIVFMSAFYIYIYMYIYIVSNYSSMVSPLGSSALSNQSFQPDVLHEFHTENGQKPSNPRWWNFKYCSFSPQNLVVSWSNDPIWLAHILQMGGKKPAPLNLFAMENMEGNTFSAWKKYFLKLSSERLVSLYTLRKNLKDVSRNHVRHPHRWHRKRYFNILSYDVFIMS